MYAVLIAARNLFDLISARNVSIGSHTAIAHGANTTSWSACQKIVTIVPVNRRINPWWWSSSLRSCFFTARACIFWRFASEGGPQIFQRSRRRLLRTVLK